MTKSDLVERIAELRNLPKGRAESVVNMVFEALEQALARDERIEVRGLGSFETRRYGAYKGRNPRTGESVAVKPKRLPFFKVGKELKDLINSKISRTQELPVIASPEPTPAPLPEPRSAGSGHR
jgi:integration host factor subunit beta